MTNGRPPLLELDEATVVRGGRHRVLDRVSLRIEQGEHVAILGPNGSGKSSLIKLITREYWPLLHDDRRPALTLLGQTKGHVIELRKVLGIITPELDRDFAGESIPAHEAVVSGFFASHGIWHHQVTDAMLAEATAALERLGVAHLADRPLSAMSTGEVRRVLIARALVAGPTALLLDEPTSGLDLVARRDFLATLRRLAGGGTTVLLVTHHVDEIIPEVERVVLLHGGRIVGDGPKEELLRAEVLSRLFGAEVEVTRRDGYYRAEFAEVSGA